MYSAFLCSFLMLLAQMEFADQRPDHLYGFYSYPVVPSGLIDPGLTYRAISL